jgi:hypothetical protein
VKILTHLRSGKDYIPLQNVETTFNWCNVNGILENKMLKIFIPGIAEQLKSIACPCPYNDEFKFEGFVLDGAALPDMLGRKAIKSVVKFTRGANVPIFSMVFYGNTRPRL